MLVVSLRASAYRSRRSRSIEAFAGWALVRMVASIPITPGGVGIVELGLTGALVGFGGTTRGVVAAVLVYRFLTVVPTLALGLLAAFTFRRHEPPALETPVSSPSGSLRPVELRQPRQERACASRASASG